MDDLTSRFLDAFTTIEKHLRKMVNAKQHTPFNEMVERAVSQDRSVRRLRGQLRALGELRNFVVHEYKSEQPLAVPSESTVQCIEISLSLRLVADVDHVVIVRGRIADVFDGHPGRPGRLDRG